MSQQTKVVQYKGEAIEVRYVELAGQKRPVAFTMYTFILFERNTGIDYFRMSKDDRMSTEHALQLYHLAFYVGGIVTDEPFEMDFEPDFLMHANAELMFNLAGINEDSMPQSDEEEAASQEVGEEKNEVSHSQLPE